MTKIILTKTHQNPPKIVQSRLKRDWMDQTYKKHAYQCLPITAANINGWEAVLPQDVAVIWDGENSLSVLEGEYYGGVKFVHVNPVPSSTGKILGILNFSVGWIIKTEKGYDTWISGPPNYPFEGAHPLSAVIPSSWWPDEFQMSWIITEVNKPIVFKAGIPFMFFNVFKNDTLANASFEIDYLWDKPDLIKDRMEYSEQKIKKNIEEPWTWTKGIKTGLNQRGERIGPATTALLKLEEPKNTYAHE